MAVRDTGKGPLQVLRYVKYKASGCGVPSGRELLYRKNIRLGCRCTGSERLQGTVQLTDFHRRDDSAPAAAEHSGDFGQQPPDRDGPVPGHSYGVVQFSGHGNAPVFDSGPGFRISRDVVAQVREGRLPVGELAAHVSHVHQGIGCIDAVFQGETHLVEAGVEVRFFRQ